ncbi:glycosyltransferase [Algibacter lectus]|uniref:Glycosyltransferase n=1 Tax=Algibacter lectus TaxID=221126 RepID=A0A090WN35_9FLAO|nr:glycosyltransferase [Algibacter lectus]GAL77623.1 glycosyltransferase [Algibacter lectus]
MDNKSILLIMPYGSVGGMERLALSFYNQYKKEGYTVKALKFIKLKNDIINFGKDELSLSLLDFSEMSKVQRLKFYLSSPLFINKIIKKYKITHSIAFGDMANLFSSLSFSKEYKIGSIHALKSVEFKNDSTFNKIVKYGYKTCYKKLNKLVCISKAIKLDLINHCNYKFENLEIIYNPHDIESIERLSQEPITDLLEQNLFSSKTVLFVGRLSIQKAPWHLIKAFKLINAQETCSNLIIIGDGDHNVTNYIKKLIITLNIEQNVCFLGRKSNPYKYMKAANVLALSSYYEGTPNVIVESVAVGTPIVSSLCTDGIIELMTLNYKNISNGNTEVEAGIITPNFFKDKLQMPNDIDINFTKEEKNMSQAILKVINNDSYKNKLLDNREALLAKYKIKQVTNKYLMPLTIF